MCVLEGWAQPSQRSTSLTTVASSPLRELSDRHSIMQLQQILERTSTELQSSTTSKSSN